MLHLVLKISLSSSRTLVAEGKVHYRSQTVEIYTML